MEKRMANRVSIITIIINLVLSVFKFLVGFFGHSQALISDAIHSASDVVSTVAVMFGINLSDKKSDTSHPYGHERIECIFSIILAMMLFFGGLHKADCELVSRFILNEFLIRVDTLV
mgnify:CR=1 FL=1